MVTLRVTTHLSLKYFKPPIKDENRFPAKKTFSNPPPPLATSSKPYYLAALLFLIQLKAERK